MGHVLTRKEGDVFWITLNRPDRGNSLSGALLAELISAIDQAASDDTLKAVVLTGQGDRFFCTGVDLDELADAKQDLDRLFTPFQEAIDRLSKLKVLTASFVNGDCVGGGLGLALSTDFVLCAGHARFGTPEITKGLFPYIISATLISKLGEQRAKSLCFGGRLWTAAEALQYGAVSELVGTLQFSSRSQELVRLWNRAAGKNLRRGKEALDPSRRPAPGRLVEYLKEAVALFRHRS
jgi:3-hydroxypropionyl-coenzyme A dehydratase